MELVVSAIAGDLVNRFISFLINKLKSEENLEKNIQRLQHLLLRVHMVVEEAEGRYITNSKMLLEFKRIMEAMYQGYHVLDTIKSRTILGSSRVEEEVSSSNTTLSLTNSINCFRASRSTAIRHELESTLENLETMVSNMTEFISLLGGCERMFRSPYDTYLYIDNFMFGRHIEKQQVMNFLLQDNLPPNFAPAVLPIIGTCRVGKKTLVAHVCDNERIRSHFSSILHLNVGSISGTELVGASIPGGRTLVVVEFTSDIDDETWQKFHSSAATHLGRGSKIIIISRIELEKLSRLGTARPVRVNGLSLEEYSYLFKVLAFGSTDPEEHPRLASVANELAVLMGGSLVMANICADIFRKNQNLHLWLRVLNVVESNLSVFRKHPKLLMEKDRRVDIIRLASSSTPLQLMPPHSEEDESMRGLPKVRFGDLSVSREYLLEKGRRVDMTWLASPSTLLHLMPPHSEEDESMRGLSKVRFGDLIAGTVVVPKEEFELVALESRIPPYKRFVAVAKFSNEVNNSESTDSPSKKRQRLD